MPTILVVENEFLIAQGQALLVEACGCMVVGPVATVAEALATIRTTALDGAVLDINLGDERVWPVAELLAERGVPFVFATGYLKFDFPARFRDRAVLAKPVVAACLRESLARIGVLPAGR